MEKETVTISKKTFEALCRADAKLTALEAHGVDNWDGYDYAMEEFYSDEEEG
jgi:hypothetical protein